MTSRPARLAALELLRELVPASTEFGMLVNPNEPDSEAELEQVQITIAPQTNWVQETYGICCWKGSAEAGECLAWRLGLTGRLVACSLSCS